MRKNDRSVDGRIRAGNLWGGKMPECYIRVTAAEPDDGV